MSYDIYLRINTGKEEYTVSDNLNYTSNVGKMYREAFPNSVEKQLGLHMLHGIKAEEAATYLQLAILAMTQDPDKYKLLNPASVWGDYEGALQFLKEILEQCEEHPACTVYLSA